MKWERYIIQLKCIKSIKLSFIARTLLIFWLFYNTTYANTLAWDMYVTHSDCKVGNSVVEAPYEVDFGSFDANSVFNTTKINTGTIRTGSATAHVSTTPSVLTSGLYLVVIDYCWNASWHADILASTLVDQNLFNSATATDIPASNLSIQKDAVVYYLDNTPVNAEVSTAAFSVDTPIGSATQLLQRMSSGNEWPWVYGVKPSYKLIIPAFQQPDMYQGTIAWTVL